MNSPLLAVVVMIFILIGSALTLMSKACKSGYHSWCAILAAIRRRIAKLPENKLIWDRASAGCAATCGDAC
jgi:hypothetical protein